MKNVINIRGEDLKNNYTEGQAGGIGIYYFDPVDKEYVEDPRTICIWFETVLGIHDKFCPFCGKKVERIQKRKHIYMTTADTKRVNSA